MLRRFRGVVAVPTDITLKSFVASGIGYARPLRPSRFSGSLLPLELSNRKNRLVIHRQSLDDARGLLHPGRP